MRFRPINFLSLNWYKKAANGDRTKVVADSVKYVMTMYGRVLTIRQPTRGDSGFYLCEAQFARPGVTPDPPVMAETRLTVFGKNWWHSL